MSDYEDDFFEGKRPWSVIKDQVLSSYMSPYLAKVKSLGKRILLIDGFAGPGVFDDHSSGSPLVMCQAAEKFAKGNYQAYFFNKKPHFHEKLTSVLEKQGWLGAAKPMLGDTTKILPSLPNLLRDQTVFLYLDPFGPTGCPYSLIEPFLTRNQSYSTEIVIMMHMPAMHRFAARHAVEAGRADEPLIQTHHQTMTNIFGGDYWKPIMFAPNLSAEQRDFQLIEAYRAKLAGHLPYTGYCPVREGENKRIKYFIVFASRHPDTMLLMHEAMIKAYFTRMHEDAYTGTLFESNNWSDMLSTDGLREIILREITQQPGIKRKALWLKIVQNHFMRYRRTDFLDTLRQLVDTKAINCPTPRETKRLNETCVFYP